MNESQCNEHSVKLAEMNVKIDDLGQEVQSLRKDIKAGNDRVLDLFSKTLERQDLAQSKSSKFFERTVSMSFKVVAIMALVAWGAEKFIKMI